MTCSNCGAQIQGGEKFCPNCGITLNNNYNSNQSSKTYNTGFANNGQNFNGPLAKKSPILALVLSLVIVGLGQLYLGQTSKGLLMFGLAVFFSFLSFGLLWFVVAIWSAIDAYNTAKKL